MVDIAEVNADRLPGPAVFLDQPLADGTPGRIAGRCRREDVGVLLGTGQAAIVLE